jgi:hypothetical protein
VYEAAGDPFERRGGDREVQASRTRLEDHRCGDQFTIAPLAEDRLGPTAAAARGAERRRDEGDELLERVDRCRVDRFL